MALFVVMDYFIGPHNVLNTSNMPFFVPHDGLRAKTVLDVYILVAAPLPCFDIVVVPHSWIWKA